MEIRKLTVKNFRGIKELEWNLPNERVFCLIGKGDSAKSTILDAIKYIFYPNWNLSLSDSDFHKCDTDNPITIEVNFGALTEEFCSLSKYGYYLRGWDCSSLKLFDEPDEHLEKVLTARLTVEKDLEPKWIIVCDRKPEGVDFRTTDRTKVSVGVVGAYTEKQLSWANGTALAKLTNSKNLNESLVNASRTARSSLDDDRDVTLIDFDEAAKKSEIVAKQLGVPVQGEYKAQLDLNSINIKIGGLALHDDEMPLKQLGLGSRRMLLCGIQKLGLEEGHITLIDEMEYGLEPHRIARLLKHIKEDKLGQYFLTTHSPVVLRELTINDLYIIHNNNGDIQIITANNEEFNEYGVQGKIRSSAEAFLAKKVIVCEGATEVGFLRGFDDYQLGKGLDPLSYHGIALLDAHGASKIKSLAKAFQSLEYSVAIIADGDAPKQFSEVDEQELILSGMEVEVWEDNLSLEERAMMDLPWDYVIASVKLAEEFGFAVCETVSSVYGSKVDNNIDSWEESDSLRVSIGKSAKSKKTGWFKDITRGDQWFKRIDLAFEDDEFKKTDLYLKLNKLWGWIEGV